MSTLNFLRKGTSLVLVASLLAAMPGAPAYAALRSALFQAAPPLKTPQAPSVPLSEGFIHYLKRESISASDFAALPPLRRLELKQRYLDFSSRALKLLKENGFFSSAAWVPRLLDSKRELTPLAIELAILLSSGQSLNIPVPDLRQALTDEIRLRPALAQDPEALRRLVLQRLENNAKRQSHVNPAISPVKAGNSPPVHIAPLDSELPKGQNKSGNISTVPPRSQDKNPYSRRRNQQLETHKTLSDPKRSQEVLRKEMERYRLAAEAAALKIIDESVKGGKKTSGPAHPFLAAKLKALQESQAAMERQIQNFRGAQDSQSKLEAVYRQAVEISRSDKALQNIVKNNTGLVQTLLLKRGFNFLDLALTKFKEIQAQLDEERRRNAESQKELEGKRAEAERKLQLAQDLLRRAQRGEFVNEVLQDIRDIEEAKREEDKIVDSISNVKDLLQGGFGDLTATFLDPEKVQSDIADWEELRDSAKENLQKAARFLDILRSNTQTEPDDLGDPHFQSVHLWAQEKIDELNQAELIINQKVAEFHQLADLIQELKTNPDAFYLGVKGDPDLQTDPADAEKLIRRKEGQALVAFGEAAIRFKVAQAILTGLRHAYAKDPEFRENFPEPYYASTLASIDQGLGQAARIQQTVLDALEFERDSLVNGLKAVTNQEIDDLKARIEEQFRHTTPEGYVHRAYAITKKSTALAEETLAFYRYKHQFLSSGPNFFQILESGIIEQQSYISDKQLDMADEVLDFLQNYHLKFEQAKTDTYEGLVKLYRDGYGSLYDVQAEYYEKVEEGLDDADKKHAELQRPFEIDFENVSQWLKKINPKEDPAIRRMGRALSEAGEEHLERLRKKNFLIHAQERTEKERSKMKESLARMASDREALKKALENVSVDDPNYAQARESVLEGELAYEMPETAKGKSPAALFVQKGVLDRLLMRAATTGAKSSAQDWINALGLSNYEVIPIGDGPNSFYSVVKLNVGLPLQSLEEAVKNSEQETMFKLGNLARIAQGNLSVSFYDWKELGGAPLGARGVRATWERDEPGEKFLNTTVLDIHQNLQQGAIFRALVFQNMAFVLLNDHLYVSLTGYGSLPLGHYETGEEGSPYTLGGRGKGVLYLHDAVSVNAEILNLFAKDPYEFTRTINTSIDPLAMNEETITIEGAVLKYLKRHAGVEVDLAKFMSSRQTFALEFFFEDEKIREDATPSASQTYLNEFKDEYNKTWKGARLLKEIHFNLFGEKTTARAEARAAWDQDGKFEPSGKLAFYLPAGIIFEARGAQYEGKTTAKASLAVRLPYGSELYASYGTDRIVTEPRLTVGLRSAITLEELRRSARESLEESFSGGNTLKDFRKALDRKLPQSAEGAPFTLLDGMRRAFEGDTNIRRLAHAVGQRERVAEDLQWALKAGLSVNAGYMVGKGYNDFVSGDKQSAYGNSSTAGGKDGGIQVGGELFVGWGKEKKEEAFREIAKIKAMLVDLRQAYENSLQEFRLAAFRLIAARLRRTQIEQLASSEEIRRSGVLKTRLELEKIAARREEDLAEALLRSRLGGSPIPKEIQEIPIDPANPARTLEAAAQALKPSEAAWKSLLRTLSKIDPKSTASPNLAGKITNTINPLQILPLVDELTLSLGGNMWDLTGNSFFGIGAQIHVSLWDPEKKLIKKTAILEGKITELEAASKLMAAQAKRSSSAIRFDRWALTEQKVMLDQLLSRLSGDLNSDLEGAQRLNKLEQMLDAARESSRVHLELLALPEAGTPAKDKQKVDFTRLEDLAGQAVNKPELSRRVALQREMASKMEEAAKERFKLGMRIGARWNPVASIWYETATETFFTAGYGLFIPTLDIHVKSKGLSRKEREVAQAMAQAYEDDHRLQELDVKRQVTEAYLRLLYTESIKKELLKRMEDSQDPVELARLGVEILELRKAAAYEEARLLHLLGLDPERHSINPESLKGRDARHESAQVRPWIEEQLKDSQQAKRKALESRAHLVQAMEGKILMNERSKNIRTEPIAYLIQTAGEILSSIFSQNGMDASVQAEFEAVHRYRKNLEMELLRFDEKTKTAARNAQGRLLEAAKRLEKQFSNQNQLEYDLARAGHLTQGSGAVGVNGENLLPWQSFRERKRPATLTWGARLYLAQEALPQPDKIGKKSVYYQPEALKDVRFTEGLVQLMITNPYKLKPGMFARVEELDRERELRFERLESDLKQARLSGLLWKFRYYSDEFAKLPASNPLHERIKTLIAQTQDEIKRAFGLEPDQYPKQEIPLSPIDRRDLPKLAEEALKFMVGEAPILGPLQMDLAKGQMYAQNILDNLRYQSMNPSLVLGYLRKGMVGGIFIASPMTGRVPGSDLFQDIDALVSHNMDSVLGSAGLVTEARERLASNAVEIPYLIDEISQINAFIGALKKEIEKDPQNPAWVERYHRAYETSLETTARLHNLYIETETDLKLLGVRIPKGLGRSSRDPWSPGNRQMLLGTRALGLSEATELAREFNPGALAGWNSLGEEEKRKRLEDWGKEINKNLETLTPQEREEVDRISREIRKDGYIRHDGKETLAGVLVGLEASGEPDYQVKKAVSQLSLEDLRLKGRLAAYSPDGSRRLSASETVLDRRASRILVAPSSYTGPAPQTAREAAQLNFEEFLPGEQEIKHGMEREKNRFQQRINARALDNAYHSESGSLLLLPAFQILGAQPVEIPASELLFEEEALERVRAGTLKLYRGQGSEALDASVLQKRQFWKPESLNIYLTGDYRFIKGAQERVWTMEELLRENRLLVFEQNPLDGAWKRTAAEKFFMAGNRRADILALAYLGSIPELLADAARPEDLKEHALHLRQVALSETGSKILKQQAKKDLRRTTQASFIYLKTSHGFRMKTDGSLEEVYLTDEEFDKARDKFSSSGLYLSRDMTLHLDAQGNVVKVDLKNLEGRLEEKNLSSLYEKPGAIVSAWGGKWGALEIDNEFRVKAVHSERRMRKGPKEHWAEFHDDGQLYAIGQNRRPGFSRLLALVNPEADTTVIYPSQKLADEIGDAGGDLTRVQIKPWLLTLGLAANIASGFFISQWTLPFSATIGAANVSDRISAWMGEGAIDEELPPIIEQVWSVLNFFFFQKLIPQLQEKLYDPSGYPKIVAKDPPSFFDRFLYYITLTLAGRNKDRFVEVDESTNKETRRVLALGRTAIERQIKTLEQDYENARQEILARFKGGVTLRETRYMPGVFGDWRKTEVQTLGRGEAYDRVMESLKILGIRFAPDGSFAMDILPHIAKISGNKIRGVDDAKESIKEAQEREAHHRQTDSLLWGKGGVSVFRFKDGQFEKREILEGTDALKDWHGEVKKALDGASQALYESGTKTLLSPDGRWLYNTETGAFALFDENGHLTGIKQAVPDHASVRSGYLRERARYRFFQIYPELLSQGGVVRADKNGFVTAFETGAAAVAKFRQEHPEASREDAAVIENADGGRDYLVEAER